LSAARQARGLQTRNDAIPHPNDLVARSFRDSLNWLNHSGLVSVSEVVKNFKNVSIKVPLDYDNFRL
jgi:hypothetical protein